MSGGSWDYFCFKLEEVVQRLKDEACPYRAALGNRLEPFVEAIHDIEWVDSADYGEGRELDAIRKALDYKESDVLAVAVERAKSVAEELLSIIERVKHE
jgi:hypothetical protein